MPLYVYRGLGLNGELLRGYLSGVSSDDIRQTLHNRQIEPLALRRLWLPRKQPKELALFFLHLRYALQAGHPLIQAITIIQPSFQGSFGLFIQALIHNVAQGKLLSDACQSYPWVFSGPLIALLHVGEQSGRLAQTCQNAHDYLKKTQKNQHAFCKALAYPVLNFSVFLVALFSLSQGLLPTLEDIAMKSDTPSWSTTVLISLTQGDLSWMMYGGISAIISVFLYFNPLRIPVLGDWLAKKTYWSLFSGLVLLLKEEIPLVKGLSLMESSLGYCPALRQPLAKMVREIQEGRTLVDSMTALPRFSGMYLQFLRAGEGTGQLIPSFDLMVDFIQDDLNRSLERWLFWITPISLMILGLCF
ncbi:MAG: type II secretion system F family protein, partial [Alphaproteobacteria bacterium]|nr:type II secretion system F family protein [Alphaproteobacteria bacterium]